MEISNFERFPSIRVAVTEACNLKCDYCPTAGDSVEMQSERLSTDGFEEMLTAAVDVGFTDFSFTGGEPLLTDKTAERTFQLASLVKDLRAAKGADGYTKLNTNGANLLRHKEGVVEAGFDELKVSLDTLDPATFSRVAKRNSEVFYKTVDGILAVKDEVPVRLQTVVGKYNFGELPEIIRFCTQNKLNIKLFDLSRYDNALAGSGSFADENYISLQDIALMFEDWLGEPTIKYAVGGYGHAKKVFTTREGTSIEIRDTSESAHYSPAVCEECPKYMCQDGLCNLVIAADGHIRFCREGGADQTISAKDRKGILKTPEQFRIDFVKAAGIFATAKAIKRQIKPNRPLLP
ncbi:MAG TPA: radical SAM protein, partial [Candidatus Saccharimonadales bacterium]